MKYQTSVEGEFAVIRTDKPGEVARQLLDSADTRFEVRTVTDRGVAFKVPLHVAERAGFVDYPTEDDPEDTGTATDGDPTPQGDGTDTNGEAPTGDPTGGDGGDTEPSGDDHEVPSRAGSTAEWSEFLTAHGIEHDENASRGKLIELWDAHTEG